jgi:N-carbamoylputrescine amidase
MKPEASMPRNFAKVDVTRTHWPFLRDRRIDAYGNLTKRLVD